MGSFAKWAMIIGGVLVALVIAVVVVAMVMLRPENYEGFLSEQVRNATGREFRGGADVSIHFFPLGLEGRDFVFGNAKGFGEDPMVSVKSIEFRIQLTPLFNGEIVVDEVHMDGVNVLLQRNRKGVSNWDDLAAKGVSGKSGKGDAKSSSPASDKPVSFAVREFSLNDLNLVYDDGASGARYELSGADLDLDDFELGKPFKFSIKSKVNSKEPELAGTVNFSGTARADTGRNLYSVSGLKGHVDVSGTMLPGGELGADLAAKGCVLDLKAELLKAEGVEVKAYDAVVEAGLTVNKLMSAPVVQAKLDSQPFDLRAVLEKLEMAAPDMADESALRSVGGNFDVLYSKDKLLLTDVNLKVDGSAITGGAAISRFDNPQYKALLKVDELNVDRYLPPEGAARTETANPEQGESNTTTPESESSATTNGEIFPVELIRSLNLDLEAAVGRLTVKKLSFADVSVQVVARDGRVEVKPFALSGYGGFADSALSLDVAGETPQTHVIAEIKDLHMGPLLKDLTGKESLQGKTRLSLNLTGSGNTAEAMKKTLDGTLDFALQDGVFPGVDVSELVEAAKAAKKDSSKIQADTDDKTKFGSITASAKAKNGILTTGDLEVRAPNLRAIGEGDVDLVQQKLSFLVKAKLVPSGKGQGGDSYEDTIGVPVPIHVSGTLQKPSYFVNPLEYIRMLGTGVVDTVGGVVKGVGGIFQGLIPGKKKQEPAKPQQ
ncbi:AsmA family protein [Salidesulfovibrio onnuriiensis]|uniref:AsmA family protein n=1 Tax=Salidesulfovibrio onnuriiensis TaxID=2583823 RepID=UPI0011C8A0EC|nr:AsmA family protein [Salidesulfovibrio onnuriiensis]